MHNTKRSSYKPSHRGLVAISISSAIVLLLIIYILRNPGIAVCAVAAREQEYPANFTQLLSEAKFRLQQTFGTPQSKPIVIFFNEASDYWPLRLNEYGSTQFIANKVCVFIGPEGQNTDVVAHELMHAEIANRVGYWHRLAKLPVWFDEGLAMQVDYRARYNLPNGTDVNSEYVKKLWYARDFFISDDEQLTKNYASAKAEVAKWINDIGKVFVYRQLERISDGESFDEVFDVK